MNDARTWHARRGGSWRTIDPRVAVVFLFQAEDGIRDLTVTGVQTCALPISPGQREGVEEAHQVGHFVVGDGVAAEVLELVARHDGALRGHDAGADQLPERLVGDADDAGVAHGRVRAEEVLQRSEEHTSELQSQSNLVCRLLLEKKKKKELNRRRHITTI